MWPFCYFSFERNYDVLKSKSPYILLNKNINFNKNETESKMENLTHSFRETNLVLQPTQESQIKTVLFYKAVLFIEYTYFYISKNITAYTFVACF